MKTKILIIVLSFGFLQFGNVLSGEPSIFGGIDNIIKGYKADLVNKNYWDAASKLQELLDSKEIYQAMRTKAYIRQFFANDGLYPKDKIDAYGNEADRYFDDSLNKKIKEAKDLHNTYNLDSKHKAEHKFEPIKSGADAALFGPGSLSEAIKGIRDSLSRAEWASNAGDFEKYEQAAEKYMYDFFYKLAPDQKAFKNKIKNVAYFRQFLIQHKLMTNEFLNHRNDDQAIENFTFEMKELVDKFNRLKALQAGDIKVLDEYRKRIPELKTLKKDVIHFKWHFLDSEKKAIVDSIDLVIKAINDNDKDVADKLALVDRFKAVLYSANKPDETKLRKAAAKLNQNV